ncbi:helix-turn-helix transcriptional regulator [Bordetella genomosp. 13]|uniref:helix-turn-helix transcriptional regulator n=1 Tax=Bordetella genomosp. 13 TaxID=463040 RepID=UPI0011A81C33|nr:helix-turn-helix transcriptional regulator [Bordetella genomosp. 13]
MTKPAARAYSRYSLEAARLLGLRIRTARIERGITIEELAERAGVSRGLVTRAEAGDMGCSLGVVFELAALVGVSLFTPDPASMALAISDAQKTLTLLPRAVHPTKPVVNDDF